MKILFIDSPPSLDWTPESKITKGGRRFPALTVTGERAYNYLNLSCAAVLREDGYEVEYLDCQAKSISLSEIVPTVERIAPEMVVMYIEQIKISVDFEIAKRVKEKINPFIIFVGPFVTALDQEIISSFPYVDVVVRGEYDYVIFEIGEYLQRTREIDSISGITYLANGEVKKVGEKRVVENLDELPIPAYDLINFWDYQESVFKKLPTATIITSRGCPYRCIYCWFPQTIYSYKWRAQSAERVVKEMKYLVDKFGVREIRIDDDMFELDKNRVIEICKGLKRERVEVSWAPQCRPDFMDEHLLRIMREAGCTRILYGCESGDQGILDKIRKSFKIEDIKKAVQLTKKVGIDVHNCFMIGFPWDTKETIKKTIQLAYGLNSEFCQFGIATPLPGTVYYELAKEKGYLQSNDWKQYDGFSKAVVSYPHLTRQEIEMYQKEAYSHYYVRPEYLLMMFKRAFKSKDNFFQTLRGIKAFLKRKRMGWI